MGELVVEYVISSVTKGVKVVERRKFKYHSSIGWVNKVNWNWWMIWKIIIGIRLRKSWLESKGSYIMGYNWKLFFYRVGEFLIVLWIFFVFYILMVVDNI